MRTAQTTISEELHEYAVQQSKEFFGRENYSGYVSMLIAKDKKQNKQDEINRRINDVR